MTLLTVGVNHKNAPVALREQVAFGADILPTALTDLRENAGVEEAVILSTCNRTELYCSIAGRHADDPVVRWLGKYHHVKDQDLRPCLYVYPDESAVRHTLRVASGLDSMVLGEPQILGQMKAAYSAAMRAGTTGKLLSRLFQHAFSVAKQVRTDTAIGHSPVSVAFAAVRLAQQIFGSLEEKTALLIGAGETIELAARHLHENGLGRMIVANRTVERAHLLASQFDGYAIALGELHAHLAEADIVISSTASPLPVLGKGIVERAIAARKHRPMFMVDIAVPRDIEPEVSDLDDIYLYTVDDLEEVIQENMRSRQQAAMQAEEIIDSQVGRFIDWLHSLEAVETICTLRENAEHERDILIEHVRRQLAAGADPDMLLEELGRRLTNKLIHAPTVRLNEAGIEDRGDLLLAARELFDLDDKSGD